MKFKLRAGLFLSMLLLTSMTLPAAAETTAAATTTTITETAQNETADDSKSFIITDKDGKGKIQEEPSNMMFWEYPTLPAGQLREGTLKVVNQSDKEVKFSLDFIDLPYRNETALTYLANLHVTVNQAGGNPLYDGSYSGIMEDNGLKLKEISLQPGETQEYHISIRCAFSYKGDPTQETSRITWHVKASSSSFIHVAGSVILKIILIIVIVVLLAIGIILICVQKKHKLRVKKR